MTLAYSLNDNEPEFPVLTESEYPETVIAEPVYSFKICGGEALTDETIQNLELLVRMYEADDTDPEEIWSVIPFTDNGFGMWTIEFSEELVKREKWKQENKRITFEMEIQGTDQEGDFVHFNNGGENYKFTFTCCEDTRTKGIKDFTLTIDVNHEVIPLEVIEDTEGEDVVVPFPLSIFKILKAEVNTYKPMKSVTFFSSLYNTADGISYDESAWEVTSLEKQDNNKWVINMPYGKELIDEEWLLQNTRMQKTYAFFVRAEGEDGNDYFFNNGDNLYKITFTCDDADGIQEMKNEELRMKYEEPVYNLGGQRLSKLQKGINIVGGKKVLR